MTVIFSDGFESGDFTAWTGTNVWGDNLAVTASNPHTGTYCELEINAGGGGYVYKQVSPQTTIFTRFYLKVHTLPSSGQAGGFFLFAKNASNDLVVKIELRYLNGIPQIVVHRYRFPGEAYSIITGFTPLIDIWYCIELKCVVAINGEYRIYINGLDYGSETGIDTSGIVGVEYVSVGHVADGYGETAYWDDVVIADSYIGPIVSGKTLRRMMVGVGL